MNHFFLIFLTFLILQRLSELLLARRNESYVKANGAREYDPRGYKVIVLMHIAFFISFIAEFVLLSHTISPYWIPLLLLFLVTQVLRYWAIFSLGYFWNTKILIVPGSGLVTKGPYKYLKHPNYFAVVIEIATIPLIFSCYITAVIFTVLNFIVLKRRIRIEESALASLNS